MENSRVVIFFYDHVMERDRLIAVPMDLSFSGLSGYLSSGYSGRIFGRVNKIILKQLSFCIDK